MLIKSQILFDHNTPGGRIKKRKELLSLASRKVVNLQQIAWVSAPPDATLLLEFAILDDLLDLGSIPTDAPLFLELALLDSLPDFLMEALMSSNNSASRLSSDKFSLKSFALEPLDLQVSFLTPDKGSCLPFSASPIMIDNSSGSRTPK